MCFATALAAARHDALQHFALHPERLEPAAGYVVETIAADYPDLEFPTHSRWRHFAAGGRDRWAGLAARLDGLSGEKVGRAEVARIRSDLAVTSVLLDAGAGADWRYREPASGETFARSEGLAVASFDLFASGAFSADPARPLRADAAGLAGMLTRQKGPQRGEHEPNTEPPPPPEAPEASWDDVQLVDTLGLEVGHRLIPLVDQRQDGELLGRIKSVRKKFAQEVGFLPAVVHIRDNLERGANTYVITLKGAEIGRAEAFPGQWLAIDPGQVTGQLQGRATSDPAFGLPAIWIDSGQREHAQV